MKNQYTIRKFDVWYTSMMRKYGFVLLRYSLAIVFFWFGILKPLGISPAEGLVARTAFWFSPDWFVDFLGWWEVLIGIFLMSRRTIRIALFLLFLQMPCTFLPLIILPEVTFTEFPYGLTLEGQYIIKNLTLIAAAIAVGGTVNTTKSSKTLR